MEGGEEEQRQGLLLGSYFLPYNSAHDLSALQIICLERLFVCPCARLKLFLMFHDWITSKRFELLS